MPNPAFSKLDVLVVDPSQHMASLVGQMLRHLKVRRVDEVVDADAAALLLQSHRYGTIMMNDVLTPSDGISLVRGLRQASEGLNRDTPVIMISASPDLTRIEEARDAGVTEFLQKPLCANDLYLRLLEVIERPRRFVRSGRYFGPDRRRHLKGQFKGLDRRGPDEHDVTPGT